MMTRMTMKKDQEKKLKMMKMTVAVIFEKKIQSHKYKKSIDFVLDDLSILIVCNK